MLHDRVDNRRLHDVENVKFFEVGQRFPPENVHLGQQLKSELGLILDGEECLALLQNFVFKQVTSDLEYPVELFAHYVEDFEVVHRCH